MPRTSPTIGRSSSCLERRAERVLGRAHVLDDALALHDLDVLQRDRAHHGVAAERDRRASTSTSPEERLHHPVGRDHRTDRGVGRGQALRRRDDVRPDVVALRPEPVPDPAEAGDHLVRREQDVVAVAELPHAAPVALGRGEAAAGVLHRLHVDEAHRLRPHLEDRLLELVEEEPRELLLGLLRRAGGSGSCWRRGAPRGRAARKAFGSPGCR